MSRRSFVRRATPTLLQTIFTTASPAQLLGVWPRVTAGFLRRLLHISFALDGLQSVLVDALVTFCVQTLAVTLALQNVCVAHTHTFVTDTFPGRLEPGSPVLGPSSWVTSPGSEVLGHRSWVTGPGSHVLGHISWVTCPGSQVLGHMSWLRPRSYQSYPLVVYKCCFTGVRALLVVQKCCFAGVRAPLVVWKCIFTGVRAPLVASLFAPSLFAPSLFAPCPGGVARPQSYQSYPLVV